MEDVEEEYIAVAYARKIDPTDVGLARRQAKLLEALAAGLGIRADARAQRGLKPTSHLRVSSASQQACEAVPFSPPTLATPRILVLSVSLVVT